MSRIGFNQTNAHQKLEELKESAFDLTAGGALSRERICKYKVQTGGLEYFYATQRVDDDVLGSLQQMADETGAVEQFKEMLSGKNMNRIDGFECEDRQVLHTAVRNTFADLNDSDNIGESVDAIKSAQAELAKLSEFCTEISNGAISNSVGQPFTDMVLVGIGGSDLGPRAIYLALKKYAEGQKRVHFIHCRHNRFLLGVGDEIRCFFGISGLVV